MIYRVYRMLSVLIISSPLCWQTVLAADVQPADASSGTFIAVNYHEVLDDRQQKGLTTLSLDTAELIAQFSWLKENDYHPVSLEDIVQASKGKRTLPRNAVLLTFDDGFRSVYTRVFPLLKLFEYPAVVALVGSWLEGDDSSVVKYGNSELPRSNFITWAQAKEMVDSGYVEIASHSYDLHHGVEANPQHNSLPAATSRLYDVQTGYESATAYLQRIRDDLAMNTQLIKRKLGQKPRSMVWPYGKYNFATIKIARELDMPITMSLDEGINDLKDLKDLSRINRILVPPHTQLRDFIALLQQPRTPAPVRAAHVDLDSVYDPDFNQQEKNLGALLDRIKEMEINTVYLQAFADPDGDGTADALYFPNRHLPLRADLFSRVAWQLQTRSNVRVYAWLPVLSFDLTKKAHETVPYVEREGNTGKQDYRRVSPFSKEAREIVGQIYEDLAIHADFSGLLFHDDAYLSDFEDASQTAIDYYAREWGLPASLADIRGQPEMFAFWSSHKTRALIEWTDYLTERVRFNRPNIKTARNLYAAVVMNPQAEEWFAQSLPAFLEHYDYTALMAMPYMEGAKEPERWLKKLVRRVKAIPGALDKTVFELQSVDWRDKEPLPSTMVARHMAVLQRHGAMNFGYYPEDFIAGHPQMTEIRPMISLSTYPYTR